MLFTPWNKSKTIPLARLLFKSLSRELALRLLKKMKRNKRFFSFDTEHNGTTRSKTRIRWRLEVGLMRKYLLQIFQTFFKTFNITTSTVYLEIIVKVKWRPLDRCFSWFWKKKPKQLFTHTPQNYCSVLFHEGISGLILFGFHRVCLQKAFHHVHELTISFWKE